MKFYEKRKKWNLKKIMMQQKLASEKMRFIKLIIDNKLSIHKRNIHLIIEDLVKENFKSQKYFDELKAKLYKSLNKPDKMEDNTDDETDDKKENDYGYLLNMPIKNLTEKYYNKLADDIKKHNKEFNNINTTSLKLMYLSDLDRFLHAFNTQIINDKKKFKDAKIVKNKHKQ